MAGTERGAGVGSVTSDVFFSGVRGMGRLSITSMCYFSGSGVEVTVTGRGLGIQKSLAGGQDKSTRELRKMLQSEPPNRTCHVPPCALLE